MIATIDFETRSAIDLKKVGAYVYAAHPSTDILCLAYKIDDGPVKLWRLFADENASDPPPHDLFEAIAEGATVKAHNANFEFIIWNVVAHKKYGWPKLPLKSLDCTMVRAYSMGLPGTLDKASKAVGLDIEKDMKGNRIMLQLSKPRSVDKETGEVTWWGPFSTETGIDVPAKFEALYQYCKQDVIVEHELDKRLLKLSQKEKEVWRLDQKINYRGIYCDTPAVKKFLELAEIEKERLNVEMRKATNNYVPSANASVTLKDWINQFDIYQGAKYKSGPRKGELKLVDGVGKDVILELLDLKTLPKKVRKALLIRQEAAKSSTAKLKRMLEGANSDNRIRGCFQFYGANTGRWSGRRVQLQNLTRPTIKQKEIEEIISLAHKLEVKELAEHIRLLYGPPLARIADCLRGLLKAAPGKQLIGVDFSAIEGRVLAWLAGEERTLTVYRGHGMAYEAAACSIYNIDNINNVTSDQRQVGKVAELALGYQGGKKAFQSMAKNLGVKVGETQAEAIKTKWRAGRPATVKYWYTLEKAAINAVKYPGEKYAVGPKGREITFLKKGSFLFARLPSGRAICYPYPKLKNVKTPWGEIKYALHYKGEDNYQWVEKVAYGGLIAENVTQAVARDILVEAMVRVENAGYPIVMHVHDEVVVEKENGNLKEVEKILCEVPSWAKGLPIKAEGWIGERYRK